MELTIAQHCEKTGNSKRYIQRLIKDKDKQHLLVKYGIKSFKKIGNTYLVKVF